MKKMFLCLFVLLIFPFISLASTTTLVPEKIVVYKSPDWTKIIPPGYRPHQDVFVKLVPGMGGETAQKIIQSSANLLRERLEMDGTPERAQIIWVWQDVFLEAGGMSAEISRLMVTIEECRVTVVIIQFLGDYPTRIIKSGRSKILGFKESEFGTNQDKEK